MSDASYLTYETGKLAPRLLPGKSDSIILSMIYLMFSPQAMDIAGLSKLTGDTITLIVGILGFLVSFLCGPKHVS